MKKILLSAFFVFVMVIPFKVFAISTTDAKELIDTNRESSIILNYSCEDYIFDDTNVKIYYIASVTSDFQYQLSSNFSGYGFKINGIDDGEEWDILKQTLISYIEADKIEESYSYYIKDNKIEISGLKTGLYLITTDEIDNSNYKLIFDSFLLSVPNLNEDGGWNYNIDINVKTEMYTPKYKDIVYSVIKEWEDDGNNRVESVDIEIYKDGNFVESKKLSSDNNWTYTWTTFDDGSKWTVVERNVQEGYNVSIWGKDNNFIIINKMEYEEDSPKTGDNINLYFYVLIMSLVGFCLIVFSLIIKKRN